MTPLVLKRKIIKPVNYLGKSIFKREGELFDCLENY